MKQIKISDLDYQILIDLARKARKKPDELVSDYIRSNFDCGKKR